MGWIGDFFARVPVHKRGVVCLGAGIKPDGAISDTTRANLKLALRLQNIFRTKLILSGGCKIDDGCLTEAELMLREIDQNNELVVVLETESRSTVENARFSARKAVKYGISDAVVVCQPTQVWQARRAFRRRWSNVGLGYIIMPAPAVYGPNVQWRWRSEYNAQFWTFAHRLNPNRIWDWLMDVGERERKLMEDAEFKERLKLYDSK